MSGKKWDSGKFLIDVENKINAGIIDDRTYRAVEKLFVFCLEKSDNISVIVDKNFVSIKPVFNKLNALKSVFYLESTGILRFEKERSLKNSANSEQKNQINLLLKELQAVGIKESNWTVMVNDIILVLSGFV